MQYLHFQGLRSTWTIDWEVVSLPGAVFFLVTSRQMKQIKGLVLISGVELAFGSCLTGVVNMWSKESIWVMEAIIRVKRQNKSVTEIAKTLWLNQQFGAFLRRKNALVSPAMSKDLKDLGRQLKWWKNPFLAEENPPHNIVDKSILLQRM